LGLLDISTTLAHNKATKQVNLQWLDQKIEAYEIHHGKSVVLNDTVHSFIAEYIGWQQGNVYATYLHGLFDNKVFYNWFMAQFNAPQNGIDWKEHINQELDNLANMFEEHGWL